MSDELSNFVYEPGQVKAIFPYIHQGIKRFVLGGPADGSEAQEFHEQFPKVTVSGFEPNRAFRELQERRGFPGIVYPHALSDIVGETQFTVMGEREGRSSRLACLTENGASYPVTTVTLDSAFWPQPTDSMALWLDIERAELLALHGAEKLLTDGAISVILLEAFDKNIGPIKAWLDRFNVQEVKRVNQHKMTNDSGTLRYNRFDAIFVRGR